MEAEYIKNAIGPILTEALQSLILHIPYPGSKQSVLATTVDPIDYLGQYLLRHAEKEEEKKALEELRAADRSIIDNFADDQARFDQTTQDQVTEEAVPSLPAADEQVAQGIPKVASTVDL
jgi:hypothetical protein